MTGWNFVLALVMTLVFLALLVRNVRMIVQQQRAERALMQTLLQRMDFRQNWLDYLEQIDRDGRVSDDLLYEIVARIRREAPGFAEGGRSINNALSQSSADGRARYVEKLMTESARELQLQD